ncbi:hypothetical protein Ancab_035520 [Ancistrocladus abbreviatus]
MLRVWEDPWVFSIPGFGPLPRNATIVSSDLTVSSLTTIDREWNRNLVEHLFVSSGDWDIRNWSDAMLINNGKFGIHDDSGHSLALIAGALSDQVRSSECAHCKYSVIFGGTHSRNENQAAIDDGAEAEVPVLSSWDLDRLPVSFDAGISMFDSYIVVVLRNRSGSFQEAAICCHSGTDPLVAKALACLLFGCCEVGDCKMVLDSLHDNAIPPWRIAHIISEIQGCRRGPVNVSFGLLSRQLNQVAHEFRQWSKRCKISNHVLFE